MPALPTDSGPLRVRPGRSIILCPLQYEYKRLQASSTLGQAHRLICTGPGQENVLNALLTLEETTELETCPFVLLAGLAGALHESLTPGDVRWARRVLSDDGESWMATWPADQADAHSIPMVDILTARKILAIPDEKRSAGKNTGAQLVDCESAALAAWATNVGIRWGVLRAVSDSVDQALPDGMDSWMTDRGTLRPWNVTRDLLRQPAMITQMRRLGRHSAHAMTELRHRLELMTAAAKSSTPS